LLLVNARDFHGQRNVFKGCQMVEQAKFLKHDPDAAPQGRQRVALGICHVFAEQRHAPAGRPHCEIDKLQEGRFSGAGWPGEKPEFAFIQRKVDVPEAFGSAVIGKAYLFKAEDHKNLPIRSLARAASADRKPSHDSARP
jgi:hypothetical protein